MLTVALGFAIATQIQQNQEGGLATLRQDELVRVLDDVTQRSTRLDRQVRELEVQRDQLQTSADRAKAASEQAQARLDQLAILAGTVKATGPGVRITITDSAGAVRAAGLLDVLQELRDAGAEVIQFGTVRIVAGSYFTDAGTVAVASLCHPGHRRSPDPGLGHEHPRRHHRLDETTRCQRLRRSGHRSHHRRIAHAEDAPLRSAGAGADGRTHRRIESGRTQRPSLAAGSTSLQIRPRCRSRGPKEHHE